MARIPESELQRLKDEISVERLVEAAGIELRRAGKDLLGRCPFHADDTASLVVTPAKNLWHCFGCGVGGGPIDWVMKVQGVSFRHAVELLRAGGPTPSLAAHSTAAIQHSKVRTLAAPLAFDAEDQVLLEQVLDYYHATLKTSPEALAYLAARGLDHPELIDTFRLGYANRTLGLRLPTKGRQAGNHIRGRLEQLGIYRQSGHEHFNGSLVIPILDAQRHVTEVYGRKIRDDLRLGTPLHLYLPGPHRGVFNENALVVSKEIIVCEALIDALSFWCAGYRNVTSAYGVEGFTDEMLVAFKTHATSRVLIAFDRDAAGERGTARIVERLLGAGIDCYRIEFPKGMDANEYACKVTPAAKSLGLLIRKAVWLGSGKAKPIATATTVDDMPAHEHLCANEPALAPSLVAASVVQAPAVPIQTPPAAKEETPALPAAVVPAPAREVSTDIKEHEVVLVFGAGADARRWRVRGLPKSPAFETLKVNLLAGCGERFHVDTFDLYHARARASFVTQAAIELQINADLLKADLGRVLLKLEALQAEQLRQALDAQQPAVVAMAAADRDAALDLLRAPDLLERIAADFDTCGLVGENVNKLAAYLAAVSRKLAAPLAVLVQSSSAAGKSALMDAVLAFVPEEERIKVSAMTGQALFYMGETNLKHKCLAICEEQGASRAAYALKLLQSDGELTIASTGKDPDTGNLVTQQYRVEGPVMIFLTTTAIEIDEELLNRCLVLSVDEGRPQTEAIHALQRAKRTLDGLRARRAKTHLIRVHQNAQRLLQPLAVVNPYADQLTFLSDRTRTRREHEKYLTLIDIIALLHQHQRPIKTIVNAGGLVEYVEVTLADIAHANALAHEVLGRSLDELPSQTRRLLAALVAYVQAQMQTQATPQSALRFTRKDVRALMSWGDTQARLHLTRLLDLEYLIAHRGRRGQNYEYELLFDGNAAADTPHLTGLIDVATLQAVTTTASSRGGEPELTAPARAQRGPIAAPLRSDISPAEPATTLICSSTDDFIAETHVLIDARRAPSYPRPAVAVLPLAAATVA